jgi:ABC-type Fe3+ transport system permease subunit
MITLIAPITNLFSAASAACTKNGFFGFPHWYQYLDVQQIKIGDATTCQVVNFKVPGDITLVILALLDIMLRIAGIVAVGFVIYGGIQYITSQGEPDGIKKAQNTITNALIGMVIAISATAAVAFIGNSLGAK